MKADDFIEKILNNAQDVADRSEFSGASISRPGNFSVPSGAITVIPFDTEDFDVGGWADLGADDEGFTIPAGVKKIVTTLKFRWTAIPTGGALLFPTINGPFPSVFTYERYTNQSLASQLSPILDVSEGDFIRFNAFHTSGSNRNIAETVASIWRVE